DWRERETFLSGPPELLAAMTAHWKEQLGNCDHLHIEHFQPYLGGEEGEQGDGGTIRFRASGTTATSDGSQPILVAGAEAGTTLLSLAKILENMEIGHNVMHGQWDWMNDPQINSSSWDWDSASTPEAWKHSHNYVHHTYTNIRGKDRDLGYEIMRIDPHQRWHPIYLLQPFYNPLLAAFFEWGVALHDLDFDAIRKGEKSKDAISRELKGIAHKARLQIAKDYLTFPALTAALNTGATAGV